MSVFSKYRMCRAFLAGLVILCGLNDLASASDLMTIKGPYDELHVNAKTKDLVVPVGSTINLICKTNEPWDLCAFQQPNEEICNHLSSAVYDTGCSTNDRIKFTVNKPYFFSY